MSAATSKSAVGHRRAFILIASAIVAVAVASFSVGGASATSLVTASTTTTLSVSPASVTAGATVTFKSTVTASDGTAPTGAVDFSAQYTAPGSTSSTYKDLAQANLVQGTSSSTASISTTTLQPGTYTVTALYNPAGSVAWNSSTSATAPLTVSSVQTATTTLSLTATAQTISADQSVTLKTTLSTAAGQPAPTGIVRFSAGPDLNHLVTVGQATVASGAASLTQGGWEAGNYVLVAYYDGDGVYSNATSGQLSLTVTPVSVAVSTTTTVTLSPSTIASGALVTISAHVVKTGTPNPPPGGAIVSFAGGPVGSDPSSWVRIGMPGQTTLDANGNASETVGGWSPGQYVIVAQYPGDLHDANSSGQAILTVIPPTGSAPQLTYTGAASASWHDSATLSATLTTAGAAPIAGEAVTFSLGGDSCSATSDATGNASCQITVNSAVGPGTVVVASAGDSTYPGVRTAQGFTITPRPTTLTVSDSSAADGGTAVLSATLTDQATSAAVAGEPVSLTVGSDTCTAMTNASGVASCGVPASEGLGTQSIAAAFGGDDDYLASNGTGTLTIVSPATTTQAGPVAPVLAGASATLTATVTPAAATGAVTFSTGATTLCTATLSGGAASCSASFAQTGAYTVTARYAGDGAYPASSDTTTVLVYGLAPGGGTFVVGDKSASGPVTFWGAQWAKINGLSGGAAPDAFKGFALNGATCGGTWSTDPGNSSPPPAGPLPAYMAVLVTSATAKTGSAIYGNTVAIVIVQTNAAYKNDPGHAGTGTVVATLCTGSAALAKPATKTTYTGPTQGSGGATTLTATLTDATGTPLKDEVVTLAAGSLSCTDKTDGKGNASCKVTLPTTAATYPVTATFAGDPGYAGSSAAATLTVGTPALDCKKSKCESLLADPSVNGLTLSLVYMDDSPIKSATVVANGQSLPVTITATSGQPANYVDANGGSKSSKSQSLLTFTVPSSGSYTIVVTAYDSDGDLDQWSWTVTV